MASPDNEHIILCSRPQARVGICRGIAPERSQNILCGHLRTGEVLLQPVVEVDPRSLAGRPIENLARIRVLGVSGEVVVEKGDEGGNTAMLQRLVGVGHVRLMAVLSFFDK